MGRVNNYKDGLGKFDCYLEKAITIADSGELKTEGIHEEAWFKILEYLQNFMVDCPNKVEVAFRRMNRLVSRMSNNA